MSFFVKILRRLLWTFALLLALLAAFAAERLSWLPRSVTPLSGAIAAAGIKGDVKIVRDRNDVPHISASQAQDVYFGLGFAHAQDRLWQMAFYRRALQGRLSELFGPSTLKIDTFVRALDLPGRARDSLAHLSPQTRRALVSYSAGVNAWVGAHKANLPPEFHLLMTGFEPWRPEDSLLMLKFMEMDLSDNAASEAAHARLIALLGPQRAAELFPPYPAADPVTLSEGEETHAALTADPWIDALLRLRGASNNWVVDGRFTASGKPLLANDPHLGLSAPGLWYLVHLEFPGNDVVGATIPGIPAVILGHNEHIAWGLTTAEVDTEDLVVETVNPDDPARYLTPNGSLPFKTRTEKIKVRFAGTHSATLYETRNGPVLPPVFPALKQATPHGAVMALAATGLARDDTTMDSAISIMSAAGPGDIDNAFAEFRAPVQNVVYADTAGDIGYRMPGRVPIRGPNAPARSLVPADGKAQNPLWIGFIPQAELPSLSNPASGRIFTANNKVVRDDYPYLLAGEWPASYRARRIRTLLSSGAPWNEAYMARMQMDDLSPDAADLLPLLLAAPPAGPREERAMALMRGWNFEMSGARPEPLIYIAWATDLQHLITGDELEKLAPEMRALRPEFLRRVLTNTDGMAHWCDDVATKPVETCTAMISHALTEALGEIEKAYGPDMTAWRWDLAHKARFDHQALGDVPLIGRLFNRSIPFGGGPNSLDRGDMSYAGAHPYNAVHGAGYRAVYDLSDLSRSLFMIAIGQSGNPLSIHYDDFMQAWAQGKSFEIATDSRLYEQGALGTWTIHPRSAP